MTLDSAESIAQWSAVLGYTVLTVVAVTAVVFRRRPEKTILALALASTLLHSVAIGVRWYAKGHLPVIGPYEMLSANVWGLMLATTIGYWSLPRVRPFIAVVMPIVIMIMAWMLLKPTARDVAPSSYDTIWLYIHIGFIKLFLGSAFIALGLAGVILLRSIAFWRDRFAQMPSDPGLDERAYRFMALALIFDTLGVVAGGIWALDAWGRYWSWDKLETWSLVTWLSIGLTLHARASFRTAPRTNAWLIVGVFVIAFFTFFGIPFVSTSLHKGQI
jgi:ABC-type transport system involved in cytochrome c biogenesis permease subunit